MTRLLFLLLFLVTLTPVFAAPPARSPAAQKSLDEGLLIALGGKEIKTLKALLKRGANVNYVDRNGLTAIVYASWDSWPGHADVVPLLLAHGAKVRGQQILFKANISFVELLIAHGAKVDEKGEDGETALIFNADLATEIGPFCDSEKMRILLHHGADINAKTTTGETALMRAAEIGLWKAVQVLLDAGANVNARNVNGRTALMKVAESDFMLGQGENDIEPRDDGSLDVRKTARLLLTHGANVNLKDKTGKTALEIARARHNRAVVKILTGAEKGKR